MRRFENWGDELKYRVERVGNDGCGDDEEYAGGVYDMALDIAEMAHRIFINNNTLNNIADAYFPDTEIACAIYDAIKYGKGVN